MALSYIIHLLPFISFLLLHAAAKSKMIDGGVRLDLIGRYSKHSPFHDKTLNRSQILTSLIESSKSHVEFLESEFMANVTNLISPPLVARRTFYLVRVTFGTGGATMSYYLYFDTGNSLSWIQCSPCENCFRQPSPLFDRFRSPTYQALNYRHPLCSSNSQFSSDPNHLCAYTATYTDGQTTFSGILSEDTLTFLTDREDHHSVIPNMVFGCTHRSIISSEQSVGDWDGVFGMGLGPLSIPSQLTHHRIHGSFTYCLIEPYSNHLGLLRLGEDTTSPPPFPHQTTPFRRFDGNDHYYLTLQDISFRGKRIGLPPGTFNRQSGYRDGCCIDTSTATTHLIKPAYDTVHSRVYRYFRGHKIQWVSGKDYGVDLPLCFHYPEQGGLELPSITLHFLGADLHVEPDKIFVFSEDRRVVCFTILKSNHNTVIGTLLQYNIRFTFNLERETMSFAPENCAQNG